MKIQLHRLLLAGAMLLAAWAALIAGAPELHAQATAPATGPGSNVSVGGEVSAFRNPYGQRTLGGGGVYVDINPTWRYGLEGEARYLRLNTDEDVTLTNYFVGMRVGVRPGRFSPYGKFLVGAGKINYPFNYATGTYFTLVPGGGIDYRLNDRFTVRAVDFEYQLWQKFDYGTMRPYGVSVGLSFRLNPLSHYPKHAYYSRMR